MLSFHVKFVQTDGRTDRLTTVKQYASNLSIRGHKDQSIENAGVAFVKGANENLCSLKK